MDEQTYLSFTTAIGEEYCEIIAPLTEFGADPHDGYEIFAKMFGKDDITPEKLHAAQTAPPQLQKLRDIARKYHESDQIETDHISEVLRRALFRWPPGSTQGQAKAKPKTKVKAKAKTKAKKKKK